MLADFLNEEQFKKQLIIFFIISFIITIPYVLQALSSQKGYSFENVADVISGKTLEEPDENLISLDLRNLVQEYPNQIFLVAPNTDDYSRLALAYWGKDVKEFVSIQDYELHLKNESVLFKKKFEVYPKIQDRRTIWIEGGLLKNPNDDTDYSAINYAISLDKPSELENFRLIKKYDSLFLYEKTKT